MITSHKNSPQHGHTDSPQQAGMTMVPVSISGNRGTIGQDNAEGFTIQPHQLWAAFCRHWFLAVTLGVLAALPIGYVVWNTVPTPFRAEAEIIIRASRPKIGFELPEDRENYRILKSREMQRVKHPDTISRALTEGGIAQLEMFNALPPGVDKPTWLRNELSVRSSGQETFTISIDGEYPQEIAKIVNSVQGAYLAELLDEDTNNSTVRSKEIEKELEKFNERIKEKQDEIKELSAAAEGASSTQQDLLRQNELLTMKELQAEIRTIEREIIDLRSQLDSLSNNTLSDSAGDDRQPTAELSPEVEKELDRAVTFDEKYLSVAARIKQLGRERQRWIDLFNTPDLPEIKKLDRQIQETAQILDELRIALKEEYRLNVQKSLNQVPGLEIDREGQQIRINAQIERLEAHRDGLLKELNELEIKDKKKIEYGVDLALLRDALELDQKFAERLRDQQETLRIEQNAKERIEENYPAVPPKQRETRKRNMFTAGAGLGTFGLVVALFTVLELRFTRVSSLKLLEKEFDFPILGTIPRLPVKVLQNQEQSRKTAVYKHTFTEAIDSVRTVLLNQQKKTPMKIIMVTSALGGEGKSTLSSHLAISFARAGRRTLLIDGDLRRPRVHDVFGIADFPGFCEALRGETSVEKCIYQSGISGLDIMPAGEVDSVTLRMLAEPETQGILTRFRDDYDLVLFDSSPILPVADSLLMMQSIDGVLLSIRKDHSRMSKVTSALKKIDLVGGKLFGGIVIGINEAEYGYQAGFYGKSLKRETVANATA